MVGAVAALVLALICPWNTQTLQGSRPVRAQHAKRRRHSESGEAEQRHDAKLISEVFSINCLYNCTFRKYSNILDDDGAPRWQGQGNKRGKMIASLTGHVTHVGLKAQFLMSMGW